MIATMSRKLNPSNPRARRSAVVLMAALAVIPGLLAGCGSEDEATSTESTVTMREYAFDVDGTIRAGDGFVRFDNQGEEPHIAVFFRLRRGKGLTDVRAALGADDEESFLALIEGSGDGIGVPGNALTPGASVSISTQSLQGGDYALVCFLPTAEGRPHFAAGMVAVASVKPGAAPADDRADATYAVTETAIVGPDTLEAGERTITITNDRKEGFVQIDLMKLRQGRTPADYLSWDAALDASEAEGTTSEVFDQRPVDGAGLFELAAGRSVTVRMVLTPGTWVFADAANDPSGDAVGPSHASKGAMIQLRIPD